MRAFTVKQPWGAAIAHGPKRIENRTKAIPPKHLGSRILIHAGAAEDANALPRDMVRPWPQHFRAIVAVATLAGCHQDQGCCRPWGFPDTWHWELADVQALPQPPRPVRGQLGLWTATDDVLASVQQQIDLKTTSPLTEQQEAWGVYCPHGKQIIERDPDLTDPEGQPASRIVNPWPCTVDGCTLEAFEADQQAEIDEYCDAVNALISDQYR
ncbi:hypothetical protein [Streptomyces sp. NPDC058985]|uniref:hypothetical protein n=1 Tax=Streptomyces sp. NPDC058985 TaxID=3346684 RepID=UPI0036C257EE